MLKTNTLTILVLCLTLNLCSCHNQTQSERTLLILHTNDSHSQVEPTQNNLGGFIARKQLIDSLRQVYPQVLLVDAGDIFQGTPYFNLFNGRLEIEAYNLMGYEAATLGNHEFDKGIDTLKARIMEAKFPYVCCNYDVTGTPLEGLIRPYIILNKGGLKIGIIGLGVNPDKLILESYFGGIRYQDPIKAANYYADLLKNKEKCDLVIALSHVGYSHDPEELSDSIIASKSKDINLILGGHTHNIRGIFHIKNQAKQTVTVMQTGKASEELSYILVHY